MIKSTMQKKSTYVDVLIAKKVFMSETVRVPETTIFASGHLQFLMTFAYPFYADINDIYLVALLQHPSTSALKFVRKKFCPFFST